MSIKLFKNVTLFPEKIPEKTRIPKRRNGSSFPQTFGQRGLPFFTDRPEFSYSAF
jgi:hypothetical protein